MWLMPLSYLDTYVVSMGFGTDPSESLFVFLNLSHTQYAHLIRLLQGMKEMVHVKRTDPGAS